jgi:pSer/pThr/pTyr-binding forkhead associated (FHA) protein
MPAFLVLADPRSGQRHEFARTPVRIGREPELDLVITGDGAAVVSATHAILEHDGTAWTLTDVGSRNGTWLNGTRLAANARAAIATGSVLQLGEAGPQFRVIATATPAADVTTHEQAMPRPTPPPTPPALVAAPTPLAPSPSAAGGPGMRALGLDPAARDELREPAAPASSARPLVVGIVLVILAAVVYLVVMRAR